ncbi:recombinase family protein [Carnobacterium sp.]|nr:recombinase family protein [Carnobacterium sp.]
MIYGYARVSAKSQNFATQIDELEHFGVDKIISEKITGVAKKKNNGTELL